MPSWRPQTETSRARRAKLDYYDLGPNRSLDALVDLYRTRHIQGIQVPSRHRNTLGIWSSEHRWLDYVAQRDREEEMARRQAKVEEIKEMGRRHVQLALALQGKAAERLREIPSGEMTWPQVLAAVVEGAKLERLTRGEPTEITEQRVKELLFAVIDELPPERRAEAASLLFAGNTDD